MDVVILHAKKVRFRRTRWKINRVSSDFQSTIKVPQFQGIPPVFRVALLKLFAAKPVKLRSVA